MRRVSRASNRALIREINRHDDTRGIFVGEQRWMRFAASGAFHLISKHTDSVTYFLQRAPIPTPSSREYLIIQINQPE